MTEFPRIKPRNVQERVYRALLWLYPRDFRDEFGDAMAEFFRDRLARARATHSIAAPLLLWPHVLLDFARNAIPARFDSALRALRDWRWSIAAGRAPAIRSSRRKDWMLTTILQDVRYAGRSLTSKPGFSALVLSTLTLGMVHGGDFSVVSGVLLRPLPYSSAPPDAARDVTYLTGRELSSPTTPQQDRSFAGGHRVLERNLTVVTANRNASGQRRCRTGLPDPRRPHALGRGLHTREDKLVRYGPHPETVLCTTLCSDRASC